MKNKSMLKGLEIKRPTDVEKEECKKPHHNHGKYFPGYDTDSDFFHEDFNLESTESEEDSSETEEEEIEIPEESKISKTLGDNTTRTVVILVLSLLILLQICSLDTYVSTSFVHDKGMEQLV